MRKPSVVIVLCCLLLIPVAAAFAVPCSGKVVDANTSPKAQVKVEFGSVATAWTDDFGNFGVNVAPGGYDVTVSDGGRSASFPVTVDSSGTMSPAVLKVDW